MQSFKNQNIADVERTAELHGRFVQSWAKSEDECNSMSAEIPAHSGTVCSSWT